MTAQPANAMVFISSDYVVLIVILLVLLIFLLILAIAYMISTLLPMLRCGRHAGVHLHLSATTKNQINRLMQQEHAKNRTEFVQNLITEEITRDSGETEEEESARAAISAYMDSPQARETFRRFVAEILLDEETETDRRRGE